MNEIITNHKIYFFAFLNKSVCYQKMHFIACVEHNCTLNIDEHIYFLGQAKCFEDSCFTTS